MLDRIMDPGVEKVGDGSRDIGHVPLVITTLFFTTCLAVAFIDPPSPKYFEQTVQAGL